MYCSYFRDPTDNVHANNFVMHYIKHTYCPNLRCRTSPCTSQNGQRGYICSDCFVLYRTRYYTIKAEAEKSRARREKDWAEFYATGLRFFEPRLPGESEVLFDGDAEQKEWKKKEEDAKAKGETGEVAKEEWKGKNWVDLKERYAGMFLPYYVGMEDDEWDWIEDSYGPEAANGWHDM